MQHNAAHCNLLQHTATSCMQLPATHCNIENCNRIRSSKAKYVTHCNTLQYTATHCNTLQHTATHCNTLQHIAIHCNMLQHAATLCYIEDCYRMKSSKIKRNTLQLTATLQHTATYCNSLQHTAAHCSILSHPTAQCDN